VLWATSRLLYARGFYRLAKLLKGVSFLVFRAILPPEAVVGRHLRLEHYALGVVIHPNTVIGDDCRIYHGVTIGSSASIGSSDQIVIGSGVLIGAHAVVLNHIGRTLRIGDGARIGANALVVEDVPPGARVLAPLGRVVDRRSGMDANGARSGAPGDKAAADADS
jgi:serine O-acetyltransferase